jgi:hypothetical protein
MCACNKYDENNISSTNKTWVLFSSSGFSPMMDEYEKNELYMIKSFEVNK